MYHLKRDVIACLTEDTVPNKRKIKSSYCPSFSREKIYQSGQDRRATITLNILKGPSDYYKAHKTMIISHQR